MQKSILDNRVICFIVNFIHDLFWIFLGLAALLSVFVAPIHTRGDLYFSIAFSEWGVIFLFSILFANFNAIKYDKLFKEKILTESPFLNFMVYSFFSPAVILRIRATRALMYMRAIALYKSTQKSPNYPFFHGYDFKKNATWFDKFLTHTISILLVSSLAFCVLSLLTK